MTLEQLYVCDPIVAMGLFIWGRWRYDIVAILALLGVVIIGLSLPIGRWIWTSRGNYCSWFWLSHVAYKTRALWCNSWNPDKPGGPRHKLLQRVDWYHYCRFMNNVGALAALPVVIQMAKRTGRAPGELMMPLAFGSLLGDLRPWSVHRQILLASFRTQSAGTPFYV